MKTITIFILFIANAATGQREPILAYDNSETCWAYASAISADGIDADCQPAQVVQFAHSPDTRSPLAPRTSPRPQPRPQEP
jgi:hypothetical protein